MNLFETAYTYSDLRIYGIYVVLGVVIVILLLIIYMGITEDHKKYKK